MGISSPDVAIAYGYILGMLQGVLGSGFPYLSFVAEVMSIVLFFVVLSMVFSAFSYVFGWIERKLMARVQLRHGPTYVGKWGILQNFADLIKMLAKENIIPDTADKWVFPLMIPALLAIFVLMLMFIPFSPGFIGVNTSVAIILVFMLLSLTPGMVFLAGWTSGNKFASIAAQRSVMMMLSYEIPLVLVVVAVVMLSSSFNFTDIVNAQSGMWFGVVMPIGFVVFFVAMLGELDRPPFDLREADSELIAGWLTDVSAPYYGLVLFLDYVRVLVGTLLIAIMFLGGWQGPTNIMPDAAWLAIKVVLLTLFIMVIRATTVRMRIDKLLRLGWKYLMPLSVVNLLLTFAVLTVFHI